MNLYSRVSGTSHISHLTSHISHLTNTLTKPICLSSTFCLILAISSPIFAADGDLDTAFDTDGKVTTNFVTSHDVGKAIAIQSDGKIVVAGAAAADFGLARYTVVAALSNPVSAGLISIEKSNIFSMEIE